MLRCAARNLSGRRISTAAIISILFAYPAAANAEKGKQVCIYTTESGQVKQASSQAQVPSRYRERAACGQLQTNSYLAAPEEIKLKGTVRREFISSSIGPVELRWPRKVELLFGRTPERALSDATSTVARALRQAGFVPELQNLRQEWNVVFLDEELPETQIPAFLISNCHPAWMTPIANLYIVGQRVVAGCGGAGRGPGGRVADGELARVLLHEIGHGVEFKMLQGEQAHDKLRAEGFASWFETYASDFSSVIPKKSAWEFFRALAQGHIKANGDNFSFKGSAEDYARASMYHHAVVERRGVAGLMQVYKLIASEQLSFFAAIEKVIGWDRKRLEAEVRKVVGL